MGFILDRGRNAFERMRDEVVTSRDKFLYFEAHNLIMNKHNLKQNWGRDGESVNATALSVTRLVERLISSLDDKVVAYLKFKGHPKADDPVFQARVVAETFRGIMHNYVKGGDILYR